MKLLSNSCQIRANVFVILVAAGSRSMQDRRLRTGGFFIREQATIRADRFSSAQDLPNLHAARECFCHFGCGQRPRYDLSSA